MTSTPNRWFLIDDSILHSLELQMMNADEFRAEFLAAMAGGANGFSDFLKGPYVRPLSHHWGAIRARIFERDDYTCRYCGKRGGALECDHVVPVAKGGGHDDDNLVTACRPCNRTKRDKTLNELGWTL